MKPLDVTSTGPGIIDHIKRMMAVNDKLNFVNFKPLELEFHLSSFDKLRITTNLYVKIVDWF